MEEVVDTRQEFGGADTGFRSWRGATDPDAGRIAESGLGSDGLEKEA